MARPPRWALFDLGGPGDNEDGQIGLIRTNIAKHIQTSGTREIEVENHEVVRLIGCEALRFGSIANGPHRKLLLLKPLAEELREGRVSFRDKNTHGRTLGGKIPRKGVKLVWAREGGLSRNVARL